MKCKIIKTETSYELEREINNFIKTLDNCEISIASTDMMAGYSNYKEYIACIIYR